MKLQIWLKEQKVDNSKSLCNAWLSKQATTSPPLEDTNNQEDENRESTLDGLPPDPTVDKTGENKPDIDGIAAFFLDYHAKKNKEVEEEEEIGEQDEPITDTTPEDTKGVHYCTACI